MAQLPRLVSGEHSRMLMPTDAAMRLDAIGKVVSSGGSTAGFADEAREMAKRWPSSETLSVAAAVELEDGLHERAAAHFEDLIVLLPPSVDRERVRLRLAESLLALPVPRFASAQVHLAAAVASGYPGPSAHANNLLKKLADKVEVFRQARMRAASNMPPREEGGRGADRSDFLAEEADVQADADRWQREAEAMRLLDVCRVVAVPTHGFANRLRLMASAAAYAARHGCGFYVRWTHDDWVQAPWEQYFSGLRAREPPFPFHAVPHDNRAEFYAWLATVEPSAAAAVAFIGGHHFMPPGMGLIEFNRRKRSFYTALLRSPPSTAATAATAATSATAVSAAVAPRVDIDTRGHACVHYRAFDGTIDQGMLGAGRQSFESDPPVELFVALLDELAPGRPVFVASGSAAVKQKLHAALDGRTVTIPAAAPPPPTGHAELPNASYARSVRELVADFRALSRCAVIVGSTGSSFSDEAVHLNGITKVCASTQPETDPDYHVISELDRRLERRYVKGAARGWFMKQ